MINRSILSIERNIGDAFSISGIASGLPAGGNAGQVLAKQSNNNYDTYWIDQSVPVVASTEFLLQTVYNGSGTTINKGEAVYIAGAEGSTIVVGKAVANSVHDSEVIGVALEDILNNDYGSVVIHGIIDGLNTNAFSEGDRLYLSTTSDGQVTNVEPSAPNSSILIGYCVKKDITDGAIYVNVNTGEHLKSLHDVSINTPISGDMLFFDSDEIWKNKNLGDILSGYATSGDLSGLYPRNNPSGYITGVDTSNFYTNDNPSGYATTGQLSNYYLVSNPSGYISGIENLVYTTGDQQISGIKTFNNDVTILGNFSVSGTAFINEVIDVTTTGIISGVTGVFQHLEADNIVYSKTNSSVIVQPGDDLTAKYAEAIALTPNGSAKSTTNRASLVILPGNYSIDAELVINAEFVDIVGIGAQIQKPAVFIDNNTLNVTANDVRISGISVGSQAFKTESTKPLQIFENCVGGDSSFAADWAYGIVDGKFINCIGGNYSFGSLYAEGTFENCIGGNYSFGTYYANGVYKNCIGGNYSFGPYGEANGKFVNCNGGNGSFAGNGGSTSGEFVDCVGGNTSFAGNGIAGGTFTNCTAGSYSFGAGFRANGIFSNCIGGGSSFGGDTGQMRGKLFNCRLTSGTYNVPSGSGTITLCIDGNGNLINGQAP